MSQITSQNEKTNQPSPTSKWGRHPFIAIYLVSFGISLAVTSFFLTRAYFNFHFFAPFSLDGYLGVAYYAWFLIGPFILLLFGYFYKSGNYALWQPYEFTSGFWSALREIFARKRIYLYYFTLLWAYAAFKTYILVQGTYFVNNQNTAFDIWKLWWITLLVVNIAWITISIFTYSLTFKTEQQ